jgi:hypothetical protein
MEATGGIAPSGRHDRVALLRVHATAQQRGPEDERARHVRPGHPAHTASSAMREAMAVACAVEGSPTGRVTRWW